MQSTKLRFTRRVRINSHGGKKQVWQRRYWDHLIRDQQDLQRHLDYIHYNPVKHQSAASPEAYPWSSFNHYLTQGKYEKGWGDKMEPEGIENLVPE